MKRRSLLKRLVGGIASAFFIRRAAAGVVDRKMIKVEAIAKDGYDRWFLLVDQDTSHIELGDILVEVDYATGCFGGEYVVITRYQAEYFGTPASTLRVEARIKDPVPPTGPFFFLKHPYRMGK